MRTLFAGVALGFLAGFWLREGLRWWAARGARTSADVRAEHRGVGATVSDRKAPERVAPAPSPDPTCKAERHRAPGDMGYCCTLPAGHRGRHVAHGYRDQVCFSWAVPSQATPDTLEHLTGGIR